MIALSSSCDRKTNCETRGRLAQNISKEDTTSTGIHYHLHESVNFLVVITPQHAFYKGTSPHPVRAEITLCIIKPRIRLSKCAFIYIFCGVYDFLLSYSYRRVCIHLFRNDFFRFECPNRPGNTLLQISWLRISRKDDFLVYLLTQIRNNLKPPNILLPVVPNNYISYRFLRCSVLNNISLI